MLLYTCIQNISSVYKKGMKKIMQEFENKIFLLNATRYADKKTGEARMILNYIFLNQDSIANFPKFKGAQVQTAFVNNDNAFDNLSNFILKDSTLKFNIEQNAKNPLKPKVNLLSLEDKSGKSVSLA